MTKAIRMYEHGGPQVLRWEEVEIGEPGPGEVLIRHTAVGLNFREICLRTGQHAGTGFPAAIGLEGAGVIEALGPGVEGFAAGQRVVAAGGPDGSYAEARIMRAERVIPLPDNIDDRTAAAMMIRGMTARNLILRTYPVQAGDTILVHAAAGGLGSILCQWAKDLGATVIGTVGGDEKVDFARAHGCDHVVVYTREDFVPRVREVTGGEGVPVVYDSVGKDTFEGSLACLRPRGVMASYGEASGDPPLVQPRRLGALGSIFLTHPSLPHYTLTRDDLLASANDLFELVAAGRIKIEIGQSYPLAEAARAHRDVESRKTTGSAILIP